MSRSRSAAPLSVYPSDGCQVVGVVFLNVSVTRTTAPAGTVAGTCCATNSVAVDTATCGSGVSSPKVPCSCDNMRKRKGDGAEKTHPIGFTVKLNVTSWFGATSYGSRTRLPL
jgi:hypothetical protein